MRERIITMADILVETQVSQDEEFEYKMCWSKC